MQDLTLGGIVKDYLIRKGEFSNHKFQRYLSIAVAGLEQLNLDVSGVPSTYILTVDENLLTAPLPDDYISYRRICVCINGQMIPLGEDKNMCIAPQYDECGNETRCSGCNNQCFPVQCGSCTALTSCSSCGGCSDCDGLVFTVLSTGPAIGVDGENLHYRNGENVGGYFGLGGGQRFFGYYKIDTANSRIIFRGLSTCNEVVLEYLGSPKKSQGKFIVHPFIQETILKWISWQSVAEKDNVSQSLVSNRERAYYNELRKSTSRFQAPSIDEIYQYIRTPFKLSPKI